MFFYLLYNSTLIEKELDEYNRSIKVLIYGSIAYIVLHAVLFIGGEEALLHSLKIYFWLFLILDGIVLFLMFNKSKNKNIFDIILKKKSKKELNNKQIVNNSNMKFNTNMSNSLNNSNKRTVKFNLDQYESSGSDSDSDIGTDVDLASFRQSLLD